MPELSNIVRERLKVQRPTSPHPDPDVLTAFTERALPEPERAVVMEHLARCLDCREILALALPATVAVETAHAPLPARKGWFGAPALRWGVVAAGLAILVVTGILQYPRRQRLEAFIAARRSNAQAPEATTVQTSRAEESARPVPSPQGSSASSAIAVPENAANSDTAKKERATVPGPANEAATRSAASELKSPQLTAALAPRALASGRRADGSALGGPMRRSLQSSAPVAAPSAGSVEMSSASPLVATNGPDQSSKPQLQYEARNREPGVSSAIDQSGGQRSFLDVTVDKAKAPAPALAQPALAPRWAISATGGLLRSYDQGNSWASVDVNASLVAGNLVAGNVVGGNGPPPAAPETQKYPQASQDTSQLQSQTQSKALSKSSAMSRQKAAAVVSSPIFRALSAAGLEVWAGGSAGALYHSSDGGQQWMRVIPAASGIMLAGDITGIAFPDSLHGQITTSAPELWITSDGGQTWQKR
ncbi:MAG TPA: zf-HC2 domain-containing protein [Candidatus Sulfotelmatobacter sp.]|nr:zf-HC2 domain-containing protein [Candidatus Sulfotelmatobacter sp.]